jgi:hypothetical protein
VHGAGPDAARLDRNSENASGRKRVVAVEGGDAAVHVRAEGSAASGVNGTGIHDTSGS